MAFNHRWAQIMRSRYTLISSHKSCTAMVQHLEVSACHRSPIHPLYSIKTCLGNNRLKRAWAAARTPPSKWQTATMLLAQPTNVTVETPVEVVSRTIATLPMQTLLVCRWGTLPEERKESRGAKTHACQMRTLSAVAPSRVTIQAAGKARKVAELFHPPMANN